jgi:hypothetical protein
MQITIREITFTVNSRLVLWAEDRLIIPLAGALFF